MTEKRPVLKVKYSILEKIIFLLTVIILMYNFVSIAIHWRNMPSTIPAHFNFYGKPDGWGGKGSLLVVPIINIFIFILLAVLSKFPHIGNYPVNITKKNAEYQYGNTKKLMIALNFEIVCFFSYISLKQVYAALDKNDGPGLLFLPIFILVIFGTTAYFMVKIYKNKPTNM